MIGPGEMKVGSMVRWSGSIRLVAFVMVSALTAGACGGSSTEEEDASALATTTTSTSTTTTGPPPTTTDAPAPTTTRGPVESTVRTTDSRVELAGPEEMVFDWSADRCEDEHIPDISARAIRNADGLVQLYVSHYVTYRMVGPDLDSVVTECTLTLGSAFDPDPARYDEAAWIAAPFTTDGTTVHAVIHNEFRGAQFEPSFICPAGDYISCIDVTLTMARSTDGGATFEYVAEPPGHLIASLPDRYDPNGEPSGLWQTSNLIAPGDGYHYLLTNINAYDVPSDGRQWTCLLRSDDLDDPASWRYWDGTGFDGVFGDPYLEELDRNVICAPVSRPQIGAEIMETVVYDETSGRYVALGMSNHPVTGDRWGVYASFSDDLITWTERQFVVELPMSPSVADPDEDLRYAYPAIIDPESASLNFDTTDGEAYLYLTRMNAGGNSLDRDLLRWPISIVTTDLETPVWTFDTAGDPEGWSPTFDLTAPFEVADGVLSTASIGTDPYTESPLIQLPGALGPTMTLRMRYEPASGSGTELGQVFFRTEAEPDWGETKSVLFDIVADGEWHDYELDMLALPEWNAMVTQLRIDPGVSAGAVIEIDEISFG